LLKDIGACHQAKRRKTNEARTIAFNKKETNSMKTILRNFGAVAVVLAAIAVSAQERASITVPFAFNAAGMKLPAGQYRVSFNETSNLITLSGDNRHDVFVLSTSTNEVKDARTFLQFAYVGNQYILQQVAISGTAQYIAPRSGNLDAEKSIVTSAHSSTSVGGGN
jgi:hypothetical protein